VLREENVTFSLLLGKYLKRLSCRRQFGYLFSHCTHSLLISFVPLDQLGVLNTLLRALRAEKKLPMERIIREFFDQQNTVADTRTRGQGRRGDKGGERNTQRERKEIDTETRDSHRETEGKKVQKHQDKWRGDKQTYRY
jgi:hypothetical protein